MDISKLKRWPILLGVIIFVAVVTGVSIFVFAGSNKAQASGSLQSPATGNNTISDSSNIESTASANTAQKDSPNTADAQETKSQPVTSANEPATQQASDFKEFFKDDAFLGDSITEGLSFYDYLDDSRVIAEMGLSITKGIDEADKIIALKPKRVFILIGLNEADDRTSSKVLVDDYTKLVEKLKANLPNSQIYVTSMLPVLENVVKNPHLNNAHIKECNNGLIAMTNKENVNYVNLGSILNDSNKNLYEDDGIHFKSDFYRMWLTYLENLLK
ncbi:GDSL-type esterase/lipase family protein [Desulfosporosinus sp. FKB]|uniref:GDSL-type esterase/lipase family protein n=1 Tax=Desulfosporosinus sp. FKB TaxID=1969835 RepID=UPI000B4A009D|nr:GDSL-type esterase/lipase family protein [Desulfosporosinus sp. FKB]